jgi:hypothetical protein
METVETQQLEQLPPMLHQVFGAFHLQRHLRDHLDVLAEIHQRLRVYEELNLKEGQVDETW